MATFVGNSPWTGAIDRQEKDHNPTGSRATAAVPASEKAPLEAEAFADQRLQREAVRTRSEEEIVVTHARIMEIGRMLGSLVSVVIPSYNRAHLVTDALDSVVAQTYRPVEIVVVDDGSTDDTTAAVEGWRTRNLGASLRFVGQSNRGGNPARNRGIIEARGEFIAFLDSDDRFLPEKIEQQLARFSDPEVGAVYTGFTNVDLSSGRRETLSRLFPEGYLFEALLVRDVTSPTSTYMVRASVFERIGGFDESLGARQDWEMWLRIARHYKIAAVPEPLVEFRAHAGPRTATNPQREIDAYRAIRRKYADDIAALPSGSRAAARSAYFRRMGRVHFHSGLSRTRALGYYVAASAVAPTDFDNWAALAGFFIPGPIRRELNKQWNRRFGATRLAIRSH